MALHSMKPESNNVFILFLSCISMFMTHFHDKYDQFCQYKSCDSYWNLVFATIHNPEVANTRFQYKSRHLYWRRDLYWLDDVSITQYRSLLSGFQPMRASVTLRKRITLYIVGCHGYQSYPCIHTFKCQVSPAPCPNVICPFLASWL